MKIQQMKIHGLKRSGNMRYGFDDCGRFSSVQSASGSDRIAKKLITTVSNTFGTATLSAFGYENDAFGRRTARVDTTQSLTVTNAFGYNLRSEVTSAGASLECWNMGMVECWLT